MHTCRCRKSSRVYERNSCLSRVHTHSFLCMYAPQFGGGLWFSLEDGSSLTQSATNNHTDLLRVGVFETKEEGGNVYVADRARGDGALKFGDKVCVFVCLCVCVFVC